MTIAHPNIMKVSAWDQSITDVTSQWSRLLQFETEFSMMPPLVLTSLEFNSKTPTFSWSLLAVVGIWAKFVFNIRQLECILHCSLSHAPSNFLLHSFSISKHNASSLLKVAAKLFSFHCVIIAPLLCWTHCRREKFHCCLWKHNFSFVFMTKLQHKFSHFHLYTTSHTKQSDRSSWRKHKQQWQTWCYSAVMLWCWAIPQKCNTIWLFPQINW